MTEQTQHQNVPNIQINAQYIKDMSFESPNMPLILTEMNGQPQIGINIDLNAGLANKEQKLYTVELKIKADAKIKDKTLFLCELTYGALVTLNIPEEHIQPILLIEVPHLLFPYARAIIANTTREAGLPPLALNPIDFAALYRQRMEAAAKGNGKAN